MAGRPTIYKTSFNKQAYKLCLLGATDKELADFFEVCEDTINEWKKIHSQFSVSIKKGKEIADAEVVNKLYIRAMGYSFDEVTFEKIDGKVELEITSSGDIKQSDYKKKVVTKEVIPDTTAQIFWLKNRQPKNWRDKQEVDHTTKGESLNKKPDLSQLTDEEVRTMAAIQRKLDAAK